MDKEKLIKLAEDLYQSAFDAKANTWGIDWSEPCSKLWKYR